MGGSSLARRKLIIVGQREIPSRSLPREQLRSGTSDGFSLVECSIWE
jgi:hypothetical protein